LQRERRRGLVRGIPGIPDEDSPDTREARELGGTESSGARSVGRAVLADALSDGMVCLSAQQLDISGGSGILEQLRRAGRGVVLFCGAGRRSEARIDALQELNRDGVPLVGVDLSMAFLQGIQLKGVNLPRANLTAPCILASRKLAGRKVASSRVGPRHLCVTRVRTRNGGGACWMTPTCGSRVARCGPDRGKPGGHRSGRRGSGRCEVRDTCEA